MRVIIIIIIIIIISMIIMTVTEQRSVCESNVNRPFLFKAKSLIIFRKPLQLRNLRRKIR